MRAHFIRLPSRRKGQSPSVPEKPTSTPQDNGRTAGPLPPDERRRRVAALRHILAGSAPEFEARRRRTDAEVRP
ncbi:hypothetical protein ElP_75390 (plasmid) [Tautonia plasticadhaerens]|uniref:Uncharacterized protein n=1 Tax=Tautonia plasticadhaerens TaxID=2527974 RepID=A0A518HFH0_9BACT|nr:hypothetical protein ElP_75390 [Tautonia plasticadhaerens]